MAGLSGKYLTFKLCEENYSIPILKVREIISLVEFTIVPQMPKFIKGVINLRGKVFPVMDLRLKFKLEARDYDDRTSIIVIELQSERGMTSVGIIVDAVEEVVDISEGNIEPPPKYSSHFSKNTLLGMGKVDDKFIMLIDIDKIITNEEIRAVEVDKKIQA